MKRSLIFIFVLFSALSFQMPAYCAESEIVSAETAFLEGKYDKAIYEAKRLIDARSRNRDELYYIKGLSELKIGKFDDARQSFEDLLSKYQRSRRTFDAHVGIGDSYLLEGNRSEAVKRYKEVLIKFPNDKNICIVQQKIKEAETPDSVSTPKSSFMTPEIPRSEQGSAISVQVGSFKNKRNAEHMSQKLHSAGYESFVEIPTGPGDRLYRVKVGRLNSRQDAEALASRLRKSGYKVRICGD